MSESPKPLLLSLKPRYADLIFEGVKKGDCPLMSRIGVKRNPRQPEHGAPLKYISPLYIIPMRTCHAKSKAGVVVGHRETVQRR